MRYASLVFLLRGLLVSAIVLLPQLLENTSPIQSGAMFVCGQSLGLIAWVVLAKPRAIRWSLSLCKTILQRMQHRTFLWMVIGRAEHWLFLVAVALSGPTLPTVLLGLWPIGFSVIMRKTVVDDAGARYMKINVASWLGFCGAFVGCAMTILAQPADIRTSLLLLTGSIALALLGATCGSMNSFSLRWGLDCAANIELVRDRSAEIWCAILGAGIACSIATIPFGLLSVALYGVPAIGQNTLLSISFGFMFAGIPAGIARYVLLSTDRATITSLGFLEPAVGIGYLAAFGMLGAVSVDLLVVGVVLIVASNYLIAQSHKLKFLMKYSTKQTNNDTM